MKRTLLVYFFTLLLAYLGGCAQAPVKPPEAPAGPPSVQPPPTAPQQPKPVVSEAEAKGDHLAAAREYSQLAAQSPQPLKDYYQLRMAENLLRGGFYEPARQALAEMNEALMTPDHRTSRRLLLAHIAQQQRQPKQMLDELANPPGSNVSLLLRRQHYEMRAAAYKMLGNQLEYAKERMKLEPFLGKDEVADNHEKIWNALSLINNQLLIQLRTEPPPNLLSGWLELAHISKAYLDRPMEMKERLEQWKRLYPRHPAIDDLYTTLLNRKVEQPIETRQVAVLLPLTGRYSAAGTAIREGLLAAYYEAKSTGQQSRLKFYDTAQSQDITKLYDQAVDEGGSVVIGPLQKNEVNQLLERGEFPVPTIALNYADKNEQESNFFQFSLLPEDEVAQVAERIWQDGYNSVAVISPQGGWGDRLLKAFQQQWHNYSNVDSDVYRYDAKREGIADSIKKVLSIDTSKHRLISLRRILGRGIKYSERRRKDVDVIFVAGVSDKDAAQIRPQLKYFGADDIPVYSTSHIYSLTMNKRMARDMDGILFCDMPWMLGTAQDARAIRDKLNKDFSIDNSPNIRLYAFGVDAYKVLPVLRSLQASAYERFEGATGYLHVDKQKHILRKLEWAYFDRGKVRPINALMNPDEQG
jgi:outer membrane PBP1 activator LpoA protein